jgi:OOP family OmpA-OmpF porin
MRRSLICAAVLLGAALGAPRGQAADLQSLRERWQDLKAHEAAVLAPKLYDRAEQAMAAAEAGKRQQKSLDAAEKRLAELEQAVELARSLWERPLQLRERARAAGAESISATWKKAENVLDSAARKLEFGRRDAAEKQGASLTGMYDQAYKEALRYALVGHTRQRLREAEAGKASEYTPRSYVRAMDAVQKVDQQIASEHGESDAEIEAAAQRAAREADHTLYLLANLRGTCEEANKARMESVILDWEASLTRLTQILGVEPDFDKGMSEPLQRAQVEADRLVRERNRLRIDVAQRTDEADSLRRVINRLRTNVRNFEGMVAELKPFREEANTVAAVQAMFTQSEGKVLIEGRDIIIRLHGVRFASGKADIPPESIPTLAKVAEAVKAFPGARVVVEGHTDSQGKEDTNMRLSDARAKSVAEYLEQTGGLDASRVTAVGYGPKQPVASNDTEDGRALNRRIEITITRPG